MNTSDEVWIPLDKPGQSREEGHARSWCNVWVSLAFSDGLLLRMQVEEQPAEPSTRYALPAGYADVEQALVDWNAGRGDRRVDWTTHPGFPSVGTDFQRAVWSALCAVPRGTSIGYGELARQVGRPGAARAVGQAVGANPWAPLIPCHRVLAANRGLGGYAQGARIKARLLTIEGIEYH